MGMASDRLGSMVSERLGWFAQASTLPTSPSPLAEEQREEGTEEGTAVFLHAIGQDEGVLRALPGSFEKLVELAQRELFPAHTGACRVFSATGDEYTEKTFAVIEPQEVLYFSTGRNWKQEEDNQREFKSFFTSLDPNPAATQSSVEPVQQPPVKPLKEDDACG